MLDRASLRPILSIGLFVLAVSLCVPTEVWAQEPDRQTLKEKLGNPPDKEVLERLGGNDKGLSKSATQTPRQPARSFLDVNNSTVVFERDGDFAFQDPFTGNNNSYPKTTTGNTVFAQGLVFGGKVKDGLDTQVRVGGSTYFTGMKPGGLQPDGTPEDQGEIGRFHVWRVHRNWTVEAVVRESAAYRAGIADTSEVEEAAIQATRDQYEFDWNNWPAADGAPYQECNGQSGYQPADPQAVAQGTSCENLQGDIPGKPGADQTVWVVANDIGSESLDTDLSQVYQSPEIGMEVQYTLWGYDRPSADPMGNANFMKARLIYTGKPDAHPNPTPSDARIDSMFVSWWVDPDIGTFTNDFAGIDTSRSMSFAYNATASDASYDALGLPPPAVGHDLLKGPVNDQGETLGWTSFARFGQGTRARDPALFDYTGTLEWFNLMRGVLPQPPYPSSEPILNPLTEKKTDFTVPGDPVTGEGWIDGEEAEVGDRRLANSSGPFTMEVGDTVDVVVGQVNAIGEDNISSITRLRTFDEAVQEAYEAPFLPPTSLSATASDDLSMVNLNWTPIRNSDVSEYHIYRSTEPIEGRLTEQQPLATVGASTSSYDDTNIESNKTYYYRVVAADASGNEGIYSGQGRVRTVNISPPANLTASVTDSLKAELSWDAVQNDNLDGYRIYRSNQPIETLSGATIDTSVAASTTTYTSGVLKGGTNYYYRVTAVSSSSESFFSNEQKVRPQIPPVANLSSSVSDSLTVELDWEAPLQNVSGYYIGRQRSPSRLTPTVPYDTLDASATSFTDAEVKPDSTYRYVISAIGPRGSRGLGAAKRVFVYPRNVTASVERSFSGSGGGTNYRLVALPGAGERPLSEAISGEAGSDWQAYYDDGSARDFLVKYDQDRSDTFTFQPGNGFWLTGTSDWTFEETVSTVELENDFGIVLELRDGWNVVSNPLGKAVDWEAVKSATEGQLQPIWAFDGAFAQADSFASAASGTAYYFFNDPDENRDSLVVPYPAAPGQSISSQSRTRDVSMLALRAQPAADDDAPSSTVKVGIGKEASSGLGPDDVIAPPSRFSTLSLRIDPSAESKSERANKLMAERRPPAEEDGGHTFQLRLSDQTEGPIQLTAENLDALDGRSVALLHPSAGETYDLRREDAITFEPNGETTELKVAIGTKGYVENEADEVLPEEVTLTSYPNPISEQGTVEYALPEAKKVTLRVYDVLGRQVATLEEGRREAGRHTVQLETERLSSGVYFGRLQAGDRTLTQKITVIR